MVASPVSKGGSSAEGGSARGQASADRQEVSFTLYYDMYPLTTAIIGLNPHIVSEEGGCVWTNPPPVYVDDDTILLCLEEFQLDSDDTVLL